MSDEKKSINDKRRDLLQQMIFIAGIIGSFVSGFKSSTTVLALLILFVFLVIFAYAELLQEKTLEGYLNAFMSAIISFTFSLLLAYSLNAIITNGLPIVLMIVIVGAGTLELTSALVYKWGNRTFPFFRIQKLREERRRRTN